MQDFTAVVPPLIAIASAFITRRVILSLLLATLSGALLLNNFNPIESLIALFRDGIFLQLTGSNSQTLIVITIIAGFVFLLDSSNAMLAFSGWIRNKVKSAKGLQFTTFFSGLAIFFTDSGNSLILGPVFRPLYDKFKICRQKLAYIIDSTSSPVCSLIPIISWGVTIQASIVEGFNNAELNCTQLATYSMTLEHATGCEINSLGAYFQVLPYQLYSIVTLMGVVLVIAFSCNIAKMRGAQQRCSNGKIEYGDFALNSEALSPQTQQHGAALVIKSLSTLFLSLAFFFGYFFVTKGKLGGPDIRVSLAISYTFAILVTIGLMARYQISDINTSVKQFFTGMGRILPILTMLILAWTLGTQMKALETKLVLANLLSGEFAVYLVASFIFLLGAILSFATGSSWSTFTLFIPIVVPLAIQIDAPVFVCIGAAISGALLGDHCSPISDTTVLSSGASGVDHISHVETQLPYALIVGGVAFVGFIMASLGIPAWGVLVSSIIILALVLGGLSYYLKVKNASDIMAT